MQTEGAAEMEEENKMKLMDSFQAILKEGEPGEQRIDRLMELFQKEVPSENRSRELVTETYENFAPGEAAEVLSELALTLTAGCRDDEFHNWNYDHLEFIIDLSNRYKFIIPKNFLNGLPEQLILLVKWDQVESPPCKDDEEG